MIAPGRSNSGRRIAGRTDLTGSIWLKGCASVRPFQFAKFWLRPLLVIRGKPQDRCMISSTTTSATSARIKPFVAG
jgi:hypothetical protein